MYRQSEKKLVKRQYVHHTFSQYGERLRSAREFGAPQQISMGFASCLRYCSDVAYRRPTKLCATYDRLLAWYTIYTFGISCLLTEFCHVQNSLSIHLRTIAQVSRAISSQLRHLSTIGKKLTKQQYDLQMSPQYGELRPTNG